MVKHVMNIKQGEDFTFDIKEPIIVEGIRIKPSRNELRYFYSIKDQSDKNRFDTAFNLSRALTLIFGVSLTPYWGKPRIKGFRTPVVINSYKDMKKLGNSKSSVLLEPKHAERISEYIKALNSLDGSITFKISEGFSWYNKGLDEQDLTKRFVLFYITIEFLGTYLNPNRNSTTKVRNILNRYSNDKSLTNKITDLRHEIFHQGTIRGDLIQYIQVMNGAIQSAFRDIIFNKITPKT